MQKIIEKWIGWLHYGKSKCCKDRDQLIIDLHASSPKVGTAVKCQEKPYIKFLSSLYQQLHDGKETPTDNTHHKLQWFTSQTTQD